MADPGFLGGEHQAQGRCQPIVWPNFAENCMKMKKIWQRGGARPKFYNVDPPLITQINSKQTKNTCKGHLIIN